MMGQLARQISRQGASRLGAPSGLEVCFPGGCLAQTELGAPSRPERKPLGTRFWISQGGPFVSTFQIVAHQTMVFATLRHFRSRSIDPLGNVDVQVITQGQMMDGKDRLQRVPAQITL